MPLVSRYTPVSMYTPGANMGDLANTYTPGANMGNILGDAWGYVKKNPLVLVPPLWVGQKTLEAVPTILKSAKGEVQATLAPFRPQPQPSAIDQITAGLTSSSSAPGSSSSSSILPIALGAGALGLVLILALGKKKSRG